MLADKESIGGEVRIYQHTNLASLDGLGKLRSLTGWSPVESLDSGLRATVSWYLRKHGGAH